MPRQCGPTFQRSSSRTVRVRPIVGIALFPYSSSFLQRCGGGVNRGVEECQVLPGRVSVVFSGTPPPPPLSSGNVPLTAPPLLLRVPGRPWRLPGAPQSIQDGPGRPPRPPTWSYMPPKQPKIAPRGSPDLGGPGREGSERPRWPKMAPRGPQRVQDGLQYRSR